MLFAKMILFCMKQKNGFIDRENNEQKVTNNYKLW